MTEVLLFASFTKLHSFCNVLLMFDFLQFSSDLIHTSWFQLWDVNMDSGPVATFQVHEYLRPKVNYFFKTVFRKIYIQTILSWLSSTLTIVQLCDLYENDSIFDKFECCLSGDGLRVATGSYRCVLVIFSSFIAVIGFLSNRKTKMSAIYFVYLAVLREALKQLL